MSDIEKQAQDAKQLAADAGSPTPKQNLQNIEAVRDLFARAHDYIAQANHPGHMGMKVAEVLNFLKFHYDDFRVKAEGLAKQVEAEAKAELSKVDVVAAKAATEAVLTEKAVAEAGRPTVQPPQA